MATVSFPNAARQRATRRVNTALPADDTAGCLGNCQQGRRDCTLPGVCHRAPRARLDDAGPRARLTEADLDAAQAWRAAPLPPPQAEQQARPVELITRLDLALVAAVIIAAVLLAVWPS